MGVVQRDNRCKSGATASGNFGGFSSVNHQNLSSFIWSVADLLRGDYRQSDYGKVILPFTVLRRLDCVLERTKAKGNAIPYDIIEISKLRCRPCSKIGYDACPLGHFKCMEKIDPVNVVARIRERLAII